MNHQIRPYEGVYANIDFEKRYGPKVYREYPKHVPTGKTGQYTVAKDAQEEQAILAKLQITDDEQPAEYHPYVADPKKEILISRARELQVPFNPKWSVEKLASIVKEAEAAVDKLPVESLEQIEEDTGETPEEVKDRLIKEAKALGIPANRLWGIPRLKKQIAEAKKNIE